MPAPQRVTEPDKMVTDPQMLRELARQGMNPDYAEFLEDYSPEHPCVKFYHDRLSGKRFMVVSGLPKVDGEGRKIEVGWLFEGDEYHAKVNLLSAVVNNRQVRAGFRQKFVTWNPQIFVNGVEQSCGEASLLAVDPDNENYHNNVLEWDYGVCKRRLRLLEGMVREYWLFISNPDGEVRVKHNQSGDFRLELGEFKANDDEEVAPAGFFNNTEYPVRIGASLTVYSSTSDCNVYGSNATYATAHDAATGTIHKDETTYYNYVGQVLSGGVYYLNRAFLFFDTSSLGSGATISAATLSLYGHSDLSIQDFDITIRDGQPTYPHDPVETGDYLYSHYSGDGGTYGTEGWSTGAYNDITVNATGQGWISKTGTTKLALISSRDISETAPDADEERVIFYRTGKGSGYQPKLVITYTLGVTPKTSSDTGSGTEGVPGLIGTIAGSETGTGSEFLGSRLLGVAEEGGGTESLLARLLASTETASGLDVGGLFFASSDVGSGLDAILALEAVLTGADSGSGVDTAYLIKVLLSTDGGLGTDAVAALLASIVTAELMVGSDRFVVKVESAPKGGGMKLPPGGKTSIPSRRVNL